MNTFELTLPKGKKNRRVVFSGPSSWKDCSDAQSVALMRVRAKADSDPAVLFAALDLLYGFGYTNQRWLFDELFLKSRGLDPENIQLCLDYGQALLAEIAWVGDVDPEGTFPTQVSLGYFERYPGPEPGLGRTSFGEFMAADRAYQKGDLSLLAAILYRKKGEAFDHHRAIERAGRFARLDPALLERIGFGFACTMLILQKSFRFVFPPAEASTGPKKAKKPGSPGQSRRGWLDIAIGMAKLDVTKIAQIESQNLYLALKVLNTQIEQAEQLERELEALKTKKTP